MPARRFNRKIGPAWTKRSTSTKVFFAAGSGELTTDTKNVLCQLEMENSTGDVTARAACRYSDDGESWGGATDIGTETLTADGQLNSTTWNALPGTPKLYVQFGANVYNTAQTALEQCLLSMRVEKRSF
jgi:hypothetical protein